MAYVFQIGNLSVVKHWTQPNFLVSSMLVLHFSDNVDNHYCYVMRERERERERERYI